MNIKAPSNWCVTSQPNLGDSEEAPQAPGNSRLNPIIPHSLQPSAQDRGFQSALILYDPQLSYDDNFWVLVCLRPVTRKQLAQIKLSFKWETCWLLVPSETWYSSDSLTVENMWLRWGRAFELCFALRFVFCNHGCCTKYHLTIRPLGDYNIF